MLRLRSLVFISGLQETMIRYRGSAQAGGDDQIITPRGDAARRTVSRPGGIVGAHRACAEVAADGVAAQAWEGIRQWPPVRTHAVTSQSIRVKEGATNSTS